MREADRWGRNDGRMGKLMFWTALIGLPICVFFFGVGVIIRDWTLCVFAALAIVGWGVYLFGELS